MFSSSCPCAGSFIVECQIGNAASQAKTAGQCAPRCACGKINEVRWFTTTDEHETCLKSSFHRFAHRSVGAHRADSNASKPNIDCVVGQHESRIPGVKSTRFSSQCAKKRPRVFHPGLPSFGVLTGRLARLHNLRGQQAFQNGNRALWSTLTSIIFSAGGAVHGGLSYRPLVRREAYSGGPSSLSNWGFSYRMAFNKDRCTSIFPL